MKHKTSELTGALLDAAVAMAEGWVYAEKNVWLPPARVGTRPRIIDGTGCFSWAPSTSWADGGPIIERKRICVEWDHRARKPIDWFAWFVHDSRPDGVMRSDAEGQTPLIAAMRAYVASKLGDEVDLP